MCVCIKILKVNIYNIYNYFEKNVFVSFALFS